MNWKLTSLIVVVILVLGISTAPSIAADAAKEDTGAKAGVPGQTLLMAIGDIGRFLVFWSDLKLTDDQKQKILLEIKSQRDEMKPLAKNVFEKREALRVAVLSKPGDQQAIMAAANDLGKAIGNAAVPVSKVIARVRLVLTPEQQAHISRFRMSVERAISERINHIVQ